MGVRVTRSVSPVDEQRAGALLAAQNRTLQPRNVFKIYNLHQNVYTGVTIERREMARSLAPLIFHLAHGISP
jgi:hypothetical protein